MKLTNILSIFVLLAVTISCSMDDETVFNDMDKEIQNSLESYAYFNIGMNGGDIATKTSSATDGGTENPDDVNSTESSVWGVFVAITYGDKVLTSYYYSSEKNEIVALSDSYSFQLKGHMFVKVPAGKPTLTCYAVANVRGTEVADLSAQTTLTAIKNVLLSEQANILPKEGSYDLSGYKTTSKLLHTPVTDGNGYTEDRIMEDGVDKCNNVKINLSQRAVAVELAKFKVRTKKGDTYEDLDFTVDSVALLNGKQMTRVASEYEGAQAGLFGDEKHSPNDINTRTGHAYGTYDQIRFYAYENTSTTKTSLKVVYTVGGVQKNATFTIKTPVDNQLGYEEKVLANHLYKLNVTITNEVVDVDVQCYTNDWKEGGDLSAVVKPSTNN